MDSLAYSSNVKMRLSSTVMVGFGLGLALLDFSSPVDAAPGDGARAAPATSVPPALLKRPTSAPARQPFETLVVTTDGPSVQRIMPPKRVALADVSCKPSALKLDWPLDGAAGTTWTTHNYTDLDPSPGKKVRVPSPELQVTRSALPFSSRSAAASHQAPGDWPMRREVGHHRGAPKSPPPSPNIMTAASPLPSSDAMSRFPSPNAG